MCIVVIESPAKHRNAVMHSNGTWCSKIGQLAPALGSDKAERMTIHGQGKHLAGASPHSRGHRSNSG